MSLQSDLIRNRYAMTALFVGGLTQPALGELAQHLFDLNEKRMAEKGKPMSDDHMKQEAQKWKLSR